MSLLDPQSLGTDTPRTLDGRTYPDRLREFERYDHLVLPLVEAHRPKTFDDLAAGLDDRNALADLPVWLASAEWRGLIERADEPSRGPRAYVLGPLSRAGIPHAA
ncbi:MAG: hypothetical protein ABW167_16045 [Baekduia sp.]